MTIVQGVLMMVALVLVANIISHFLPFVPDAIIQIVLGLIIALVINVQVPVATDWFMLLFIAPLLYNDGRHFSHRALWALRGQIVSNAVVLVFATMFLIGLLIHILVPPIPLAAAVALAALLAPTDAIAVEGIAEHLPMPKKVLHLVAGESLINDASGLIGFKYGIAVALTGEFAAGHAALDFLYVSLVGALAGAVLMGIINWVRKLLFSQGIGDVTLHTVLQLITPFIIYLLVDEGLHASGVIAVVIAGLLSNSRRNNYGAVLPELKLVSEHAWSIMVYVLNGLIFVLLGIELPVAMRATIANHDVSTLQALGIVVVVFAALLALRTAWVYSSNLLTAKRRKKRAPSFASALLTGIAGVRGAITVIGVLAIPVVTTTGQLFPERSLMLFIAAGVTLMSLLVATIGLPIMAHLAPQPDIAEHVAPGKHLTWSQAQAYVLKVAVQRLETEKKEDNQKPALDLISDYQRRQRKLRLAADTSDGMPVMLRDELELKIMGTTGELQALNELHAAGKIPESLYRKLHHRLTLKVQDMRLLIERDGHRTVGMRWRQFAGKMRHRLDFVHVIGRMRRNNNEYLFVLKATAKGALANISATLKSDEYKNRKFARSVIKTQMTHYRSRIATVHAVHNNKYEQYQAEMQRLRMVGFTAERAAVHQLMEQGYITPLVAQKLSTDISYSESAITLSAQED
ncbi:cation:proton antiporter [Lacticaseibacillus sharpeae]|uniref:NhaP-type Na H and K H antiporter n=1 Tax=Lacticaseibacillus sharpeae JCM 1186 = DSM 20505 TaxID=1291052 RepID=A0A0R1ZVA0_9LACO|nr:sodium:proton antiporter [Lacticaseibacillus sharpeae]KRM54732.1 NhaP-type Na H and K H antiporter [Lacticaseibacillus sharpeae JCM 1186 = DSM 20505]